MPLDMQALVNNGLLDELAARINNSADAGVVLAAVNFPAAFRPSFARANNSISFWLEVCEQIENGRITGGFEPLLQAAARRLPGNRVLAPFANPAPPAVSSSGAPVKRDPAHAHVTSKHYDVFISYSRRDSAAVTTLAQTLQRRGVRVWLDEWEIPLGVSFTNELEQIISQVKSVLVCFGDGGLGPWQGIEVQAALGKAVRKECGLIPLLLPGVTGPEALPLFLRTFNGAQLKGTDDEGTFDKLVEAIQQQNHATRS